MDEVLYAEDSGDGGLFHHVCDGENIKLNGCEATHDA